jgi:putative PIN family toxin of toxin-antitoxin system
MLPRISGQSRSGSEFIQTLSAPGRIAEALFDGDFTLVASEPLLQELKEVLDRPEMRSRVKPAAAARLIALLRAKAEMVEISGASQGCRDPKDDKFIESARVGGARFIVTADRDLLEEELPGIRVVSAFQFVQELYPFP